jgi:hypothetical protein
MKAAGMEEIEGVTGMEVMTEMEAMTGIEITTEMEIVTNIISQKRSASLQRRLNEVKSEWIKETTK